MRKIIKWIVIILIILFCVGIFTEDENENTRNHSTLSSLGRGEGSSVFSAQELRNKQVVLKGAGKDKVTVLVYMNGSDLETESQEATTDLKEIVNASDSENVKIVVQTMGTKTWSNEYGIASDRTQRYLVDGSNLKLVDDSLSQLDCTIPDTLGDFIKWGATNYPADRYILLFWNHGGGPVYGYGYDEYLGSEESLTIDEIQTGLKNGGIYFDFIGMDCCLMSSIEVCCALYDYCDYTILSEDFESGYGWNYTGWISKLTSNPSIPTEELAKIIIDDTIKANEEGDLDQASTLALIDESYMKILYTAWTDFAYKNLNVLTEQNYSTKVKGNRRALPKLKEKGFFSDWLYSSSEEYNMEDYYITDLMALAENIDSEESKALSSAMKLAIVYFDSTSTEKLTGISVTLPYGDMEFYQSLSQIFLNCGFDNEYVSWLENFVSSEGNYNFYDYDSWYDDWEGWDNYEEEYDLEDWYYWNDNHEFEDEFDWDNWDYYDDEDYWDWEFEDEDIWYDGHGDYRDDYRYEEEEYYDDDFWNFWW